MKKENKLRFAEVRRRRIALARNALSEDLKLFDDTRFIGHVMAVSHTLRMFESPYKKLARTEAVSVVWLFERLGLKTDKEKCIQCGTDGTMHANIKGNFFHCFACQKGGGPADAISYMLGADVVSVMVMLATIKDRK